MFGCHFDALQNANSAQNLLQKRLFLSRHKIKVAKRVYLFFTWEEQNKLLNSVNLHVAAARKS